MVNTYISAKLVDLRHINVMINSQAHDTDEHRFYIRKDNGMIKEARVVHKASTTGMILYTLALDEEFEFGRNYELNLHSFSPIPIDVSDAPSFPEFDEMFTYKGDDLGPIYSPLKTSFALWAPIAQSVFLKIEDADGNFDIIPMIRRDKGVYKLVLKGDYHLRRYHYIVNNYSVTKECNDPYGRGASLNSQYSVVVDTESITKQHKITPKTHLDGYTDHIIYETHIRDLTEHKGTDIEHKGTYTGFAEEGRKTLNGKPAGLDYIKYLGVTTVQIQPILDYHNVDDINHEKQYNWGYDPTSMFALEGSLSVNPADPECRLHEVRHLVDTYHKNDLRIVVDVVYNHVYDYVNNDFEKVVPNYFFRRRNGGYLLNHSGCGDDFASERPMARKAIIDSLKYLTETYDVDGFRFDIMGLIDYKTINDAYAVCKAIKPDIIFYGEGWDMYSEARDEMASMANADKIPNIAFFNDVYRNTIAGPGYEDTLWQKGYVGGNTDYNDGAVYCIFGCSILFDYAPKFASALQSVNYIECHDNHTLYDKLDASCEGEDEATLLKRVTLANTIVSLSFGIPFFHMGQEIGLSKCGLGNTYNTVKINNLSYKLVEERWNMVEAVRNANLLRRHIPLYTETDMKKLRSYFNIDLDHYPLILITTKNKEILGDDKIAIVVINNQKETQNLDLDDYYELYYYNGVVLSGGEWTQHMIVPPLSVSIIVK